MASTLRPSHERAYRLDVGAPGRPRPAADRPALAPPPDPPDGRRRPQDAPGDIAFALGRGLFAVMLDLRDLLALGLLQPPSATPADRPSTAPRTPPAPPTAAPQPSATPLPRRKR
ncbi:hypothetical protein ABT404_36155 [Streptomyces hyaluromycini]|uniref:Uncharacterized protein n=1 Tax=Streptomyces hyaluromycini TaxID=1377993 RepID=A0ABV1X732_9ACTN